MKKAMLFFVALLFTANVNAASMDLAVGTDSSVDMGASVPALASTGDALLGNSGLFATGDEIEDDWGIMVTEASNWVFRITANGLGADPSPFEAMIDGATYVASGAEILFSIFLDVGKYTLEVDGTANNTFTSYDVNINAVPIPAAALLFAPALLGFFGLRRKAKIAA